MMVMIQNVWSEEYTGPLSAGPEYFKCGTYKLKGQLFKRRKKTPYLLKLYPGTTRESKIRISGKKLRYYYNSKAPVAISLTVNIIKEGHDTNALAKVIKINEIIRKDKLYVKTVRMLEKRECPLD